MWTQASQRTLPFRNAVSLLEAGGYTVTIEREFVRLYRARTGREWECASAEEFYEACAFYCWEAFEGGDTDDARASMALQNHSGRGRRAKSVHETPASKSASSWTAKIFSDLALRAAIRTFYEKGYAVRIAANSVTYFNRWGVQQQFCSRQELLRGVVRLGSETQPRQPTKLYSLSKILAKHNATTAPETTESEHRTLAAESERESLRKSASKYIELREFLLNQFDPTRSSSTGLERALKEEVFKIIHQKLLIIEEG